MSEQGNICHPPPQRQSGPTQAVAMPLESLTPVLDILVGDEIKDLSTLQKPCTILMGQKGLVEIRKSPNYIVIKHFGSALDVRVTRPLPWSTYARIVGLFKQVHKKYDAEALVYLWWDATAERIVLTVPKQRVSSGSATPDSREWTEPLNENGNHEPGRYSLWGHIHSHNTMKAFFSGTDDAGEQQDGLIYGVVGLITQRVPEVKFRIRMCGVWTEVPFETVIDRISFPEPEEALMENISDYKSGNYRAGTSYQPGLFYPRTVDDARNFDRHSHNRGGNGRSTDTGVRQISGPLRHDHKRTQTEVGGMKYIIRVDGRVDCLWLDGTRTFSGKRVEDLSTRERGACFMEGIDWDGTANKPIDSHVTH